LQRPNTGPVAGRWNKTVKPKRTVKELTTNKLLTTCSLDGDARGMSDCMTWLMLPASKSGVAELPPLLWTSKVAVDDMTDLLYVLSREGKRG
jgi:hypothetical protein